MKKVQVEVWSQQWGYDCSPDDAHLIIRQSSGKTESDIRWAVEEWYQDRYENDAAPNDDYVYAYGRIKGTKEVYRVRLRWSLDFEAEFAELQPQCKQDLL